VIVFYSDQVIHLLQTNPFKPPFYLRNPHLQTVLNSQGPRRLRARLVSRRLNTQALILAAEDGTRLLAELDRSAESNGALVVLLHGWEGSSRSCYMYTTAAQLLSRGFDVLRLNLRDHGNSHHLNRELFNSTRSPEVASALVGFVAEHGYRRVFVGGFSLGGSFALRVAADRGADMNLIAAFGVSPPIDPARAMDALNRGPRTYEQYFFTKWRDSLQRKLAHFPEYDYADELATARTIDDLNRIFIPRYTVYENVDDYFAAYALVGNRLAGLTAPAYLIASEDDPIIPVADIARIDPIENLHIETHRHGGHCGFIENLTARSWVERRIVELVDRHL
jgi:predicted alpha/beta-fold hydrolase